MCTRNPIHCIIPPHMLKEISERGDDAQREFALRNLLASASTRGQREVRGVMMALATPAGQKRRTIYDAQNGLNLPGQLVRGESDGPTGDPAVDEAFDGAGATYDFFKAAYGRNSIDDRGLRLDSTVHYRQGYNNAFWDGQQMVYGDGDGALFQRFTRSIDIIAHELTHGVTDYEAGLEYHLQPGALNEHMSDVFGSMVKQKKLGHTAAKADWLIGEGILAPGVNGVALRSMKAPGTAYNDAVLGQDPQPAHMNDYVVLSDTEYDDWGGVHINSGIPNYAFYVTARAIGGNAWEKAGRIWYIALRDRLGRLNSFQEAAEITYQVAAEKYGANSKVHKAVKKGWDAVGISV